MTSKIFEVIERYSKFENILPGEIVQLDINELELIKDRIKVIIEEDLKAIKKLSIQKQKIIDFDAFKNPETLMRSGFFIRGDPPQEKSNHLAAHWYMSAVTLEMLSSVVFKLSVELVNYHQNYQKTNTVYDKRVNFNRFVRTWQDFYGYMISIRNTIYDYHDLYIRAFNEIDPKNKETPYYRAKSNTWTESLHSAVKELLLHGNLGRTAGFALLRSTLEVHLTRELFDLSKSKKYSNSKVIFKDKYTPTVNKICNAIESVHKTNVLKTDIIRRIYDWGSKVSHRGFRTDEYVTWFIFNILAQICNLYTLNLEEERDKILDDLVRTNQIEIIKK